MMALFLTLERIRHQEIPVLIGGETGSGKEVVARSIHESSPRRSRPLSIVHCACLPDELFESELFGHEAGAFTGAETDQEGILENAAGGTVLLDEVGDLSLASQAKLLRFIESGSLRRLGSTETRIIDVRVLATTSVRLEEAVASKRFRADLYYRLRALEIVVPPLRERRDDIPLLARHFLERHASRLDCAVPELLPGGAEYLAGLEWPGNVRELELFLLRVLVQRAGADRLGAEDLAPLRGEEPRRPSSDLLARPLAERRKELEREYLARLFVEHGGDMGRVMKDLGVRSTKLYDWMRDLGLDIRELRRRLRR
jgi:DNA-binding NtrC family response regulator